MTETAVTTAPPTNDTASPAPQVDSHSHTLALFEGLQRIAPSSVRDEVVNVAKTTAIDSMAKVAHWMTPYLATMIRRQIELVRASLAVGDNDPLWLMASKMCTSGLLAVSQPLIAPAIDKLIDVGAQLAKDVSVSEMRLGEACKKATDSVRTSIASFGTVPTTPHGWAKWCRNLLVSAVQHGALTWMMDTGRELSESPALPPGTEGPLARPQSPSLGWVLQTAAPVVAQLASASLDYALHRAVPMVDVDANALPEQGSEYSLFYAFQTLAGAREETWRGCYKVSLELTGTVFVPFFEGSSGTIVVTMIDGDGVEGVVDMSAMKLQIGRYTLSGLAGTYRRGVGLTIDTAKMSADGETPTFGSLTISPFGWLSGSFHLGEQRYRFGTDLAGGTGPEAPVEQPRSDSDGRRDERGASSRDGGLLGHIKTGLDKSFGLGGTMTSVLTVAAREGVAFGNYVTSGRNLVGAKAPLEVEPQTSRLELPKWLSSLAPDAIFDRISSLALVPESFKERLKIRPDEFRFGPEPSLTIGASVSIRPFPSSSDKLVDGLTLIWMVGEQRNLFLQARDIKIDDDNAFHGVEADPSAGLRIATAKLGIPVPKNDVFSVPKLKANADGLTIGKGFNARRAGAELERIAIGQVLKVDRMGLEIASGDEADKEVTAYIAGGALELPSLAMGFDGKLTWRGESAKGEGTAKLTKPLAMFDGTFTIQDASVKLAVEPPKFSGTTDVKDVEVAVRGYRATGGGSITVDERGLARLVVASAQLLDKDKNVAVELTDFTYDRGKVLRVGGAKIRLPDQGMIRGERASQDAASYLHLTGIDLSALLHALPPAEGGAKVDDTTELTPPEPKPPLAIFGENLERIVIGPGKDGIVELLLSNPGPGETASGLHGTVVLHLGRSTGRGEVAVDADPSALDRLVAVAHDLELGSAGSIERVEHRDDQLTVTRAALAIRQLFGALWPADLGLMDLSLTAGFVANTATRRLVNASAGVKDLAADLFDHTVQLGNGEVSVGITAGELGPAGEDAIKGTVTGSLSGSLGLHLLGADLTATGKLGLANGRVDGTLDASGGVKDTDISVDVHNLAFVGGKRVMVEKATIKLPAPKSGEVVQFLPPASTAKTPTGAQVEIVLSGVGLDLATGKIEFARAEDIKGGEAERATSSGANDQPTRQRVAEIKNLGGIRVGDDLIVARLTEDLTADLVRGKDEIAVGGSLSLKLGPLTGTIEKAQVFLPYGASAPAKDDAQPSPRGRVQVAKATIGGFEVEDLTVNHGTLFVGKAGGALGKILGALPIELGELKQSKASLRDLVITSEKEIQIGGIDVTGPDLSLFDQKLKILGPELGGSVGRSRLGADASLVPSGWSAELSATQVVVQPAEGLAFTADAPKLAVDPKGLSATILAPTATWVSDLRASARRLELTPGAFMVYGAEIGVSPALIGRLPGATDLVALLPSWAGVDKAGNLVVALRGIDFGYANGKVQWPALSTLRFGIRRGGLKLAGVTAGFDLDHGTFDIGAAFAKDFSITAQIPIGQGVGIELGAGLHVGLDFTMPSKIAKTDEDVLQFSSQLSLRASLEGYAKAGIYGGVPSVFSAAGGVYVGLQMDMPLRASVKGAVPLPTSKSAAPAALDAFFELKDGNVFPQLKGTAGAYVSLHFLGTSKTLRKQLAEIKLAELHAHGGVRFRGGEEIDFLPSRDRFPYHRVYMDEQLRKTLFDEDFTREYKRSQARLDKSFAKVWAAEDLEAHDPGKQTGDADPDAKPWTGERADLRGKKEQAADELVRANAALAQLDEQDHASGKLLADLRDDLARLEWRVGQLRRLDADGKADTRSLKRFIQHPTWGGFQTKAVNGRAAFEMRGRVAERDPAKRVGAEDFAKSRGRTTKKEWLDADAVEQLAEAKREEISVVEQLRDSEQRIKVEDDQASAEARSIKATTKYQLAKKSRGDVGAELDKSRDGLLASLYAASKQEAKNDDKKLEGAVSIEQLGSELMAAKRELATFGPAPEVGSPGLDAKPSFEDQAREAQRQFWAQHVQFLDEEIAFVTNREKNRNYSDKRFDDRIEDDHQTTLGRAARERPNKVAEIEKSIAKQTETRRAEIERSVRRLDAKLAEIAGLTELLKQRGSEPGKKSTQLDESRERYQRALDLQKKQLLAYIDNIARLTQLLDGEQLARTTDTFDATQMKKAPVETSKLEVVD